MFLVAAALPAKGLPSFPLGWDLFIVGCASADLERQKDTRVTLGNKREGACRCVWFSSTSPSLHLLLFFSGQQPTRERKRGRTFPQQGVSWMVLSQNYLPTTHPIVQYVCSHFECLEKKSER